jgi:hypothetical protein
MSKVEFLKPDTEEIGHQIQGIPDSYSHGWDLLSELTQNAVNAIREGNPVKGHIELSINAATRHIRASSLLCRIRWQRPGSSLVVAQRMHQNAGSPKSGFSALGYL